MCLLKLTSCDHGRTSVYEMNLLSSLSNLTSYISSSCCRVKEVPSSNVIELSVVILEIWQSHTSKKPTLIRISWSSCERSQNPGIRFANSTTLCTDGVTLVANCCHSQILWDSTVSAVEDAASGSSGLAGCEELNSQLIKKSYETDLLRTRCHSRQRIFMLN